MSSHPAAPAELPRLGVHAPRPKTPRRRESNGNNVIAEPDNVPVKQGSRATATPWVAAGVAIAVCIALGVALSNDFGGAEPRCVR